MCPGEDMVHIRWADAPSQRDRGPQDAPPIGEGSSALAVANAQRVVQRVSTELSLSLSDKRHSLDACFRLFGSRAGMTQPLMLSCSSMTKRNETKRNETKRNETNSCIAQVCIARACAAQRPARPPFG